MTTVAELIILKTENNMEYINAKHNTRLKRATESSSELICYKVREARGTGWISFNHLKLKQIPGDLFIRAPNLKYLYASNCALQGELSINLGTLTKLCVIDASFNKLVSLPENLFANLNELTILDLSNNKLTSLPYTVGEMQNCKELMLAHNDFVALPHTISRMKRLEILDASHNMISLLQGAMFAGGLGGTLHVLRLNNNQLDRIPREVGRLSQLEELDISNNQLYFLPSTCRELKRLQVIRFKGNKWTNNVPRYQEKMPRVDDLNASYGERALRTARALVHPDA